jgi:tetratricopeptide (TPR) repeat protein
MAQISRKKRDIIAAQLWMNRAEAVQLGGAGSELVRLNLLTFAHKALEAAVAKWPNDASLQAEFANCLRLECRPDEAMKHSREALECLPISVGRNTDPQGELGSMMFDPELEPMGMEVLDEAIRTNPNNPEGYRMRGSLHERAGRSLAAAADYRKSVSLDPNLVASWKSLAGLTQQGLFPPEEAQQILKKLIDLNPEPVYHWTARLDLTDFRDLPTAYRAIWRSLHSWPPPDDRSIFPLHSLGNPRMSSVFPKFEPSSRQGRLTGWYFQMSSDIEEIARLYHPTAFPFE